MGNCFGKKEKEGEEEKKKSNHGNNGENGAQVKEVPLADMPPRDGSAGNESAGNESAGQVPVESCDIADLEDPAAAPAPPTKKSSAMERLEQRLTMSSRASVYAHESDDGGVAAGDISMYSTGGAGEAKYQTIEEEPVATESARDASVLMSGFVTKQGGTVKTWKRRWLVLRDGSLSYYANPGDEAGDDTCESALGVINLAKVLRVEDKRDRDGGKGRKHKEAKAKNRVKFFVLAPGRDYKMMAESEGERDAWIRAIQDAVARAKR